MKLSDYARCDGIALAQLIRKGEVSRREVAQAANQAIDELNEKLNFMAHYTPETAENMLSGEPGDGEFCGVPFLVKEGSALKGEPWNMASRLGVGRVAEEDEELIKRFKKTGVTVLGLSTAPEGGNAPTTESILHGPTLNPWNTVFMPGGSSGGAAAAVAASAVPITHAADGGGSIRIPASCCGLVGLKPTRARTPGCQNGIYSLGVHHIVSRTVRDTAAMLDGIHGAEVGSTYYVASPPERPYIEEITQPPKQLKIAFSSLSPSGAKVHKDCIKAVEDAATLCESLGHFVEEAPLPYDWEPFCKAFTDLWSYKHPYGVEQLAKATGLGPGTNTLETCNLSMLEHARQMSMLEFESNMVELNNICISVGKFFTQYDVFISPVTTQPALKIGELNANAPDLTAHIWVDRMLSNYALFTPIFNATGQPAISLPLYHSAEGLPIGVQFAAGHSEESVLFQLAGQLEQVLPWKDRKPVVSVF